MTSNVKKVTESAIVTLDQVERKIFLIRGQQILLDSDLAALYGVETRVLNQAVRRNIERFPEDFLLTLTREEFDNLISQSVTSSSKNFGGRRKLPFAFTEQGVAMLSSVLNSERAVQVNIAIMRAFVNMRKLAVTNEEVAKRLAVIERKIDHHDENFKKVFGAIRAMLNPPAKPQKRIGYIQEKKKRS